jgi:hypothetical protein
LHASEAHPCRSAWSAKAAQARFLASRMRPIKSKTVSGLRPVTALNLGDSSNNRRQRKLVAAAAIFSL